MNDLFSLAKYLNREDEFIVWITASRALLYINKVLALNENYEDFQAYLRTLIDNRIRSVNWSFVGRGQDLPKIIQPDLRFITYCTAIRHGGQEEWTFLERQLILNETVNEIENENKMLALTCSRDKEIMKRDFTESTLNALTKYPYSLFSGRNYEKILLTEANHQIDPELRQKVKYLFEISSEKPKWTEVYSAIIQWLKENVPIVTHSL
ncbi:unnamed protein product [Schistosoma mattheei]|uniref:ERAP1_C domain-containing protein n=1 Tax=Schistosoma mattheei TaxID=31246 RepID=A0A3P8FX11_9TREM|nr:unnamed protein product [Schistosoma mattheei]